MLAPVCPRRLPYVGPVSQAAYYAPGLCRPDRSGCSGVHWDELDIEASGNGDRPPFFTHVEIFAGDLRGAFPFAYPARGHPLRLANGLFARSRSRPLFFGAHVWAGRRGTLVLAPPYPSGGVQGDHLVFRWRRGSVGYAIGIHAWEPLVQAGATLRAIVVSTG